VSNFWEFRNLVKSIEKFVAAGTLSGHELFMFADNSTAEAAFLRDFVEWEVVWIGATT
jgi:hypothetical protein